jgi:uncharacterized protein (TIGR00730 family)
MNVSTRTPAGADQDWIVMSTERRPLRSVAVFCGAQSGNLAAYCDSARELGLALAERGLRLVYGGSSLGIMATVAHAVLDNGGHAVGVIPHHLIEKEKVAGKATHIYVVKSMHARKSLMYHLSDAFVALPGGLGTLDELFEVLTWAKLGLHGKPVAVLNTGAYFDHLLSWLDHAHETGFLGSDGHELLRCAETVDGLLDQIGAPVGDPVAATA